MYTRKTEEQNLTLVKLKIKNRGSEKSEPFFVMKSEERIQDKKSKNIHQSPIFGCISVIKVLI